MHYLDIIKDYGYRIVLVFFWTDSVSLAIEPVKTRVHDGGHNIPEPEIKSDYWMIFDISVAPSKLVAEGYSNGEMEPNIPDSFHKIKNPSYMTKKDNGLRGNIVRIPAKDFNIIS